MRGLRAFAEAMTAAWTDESRAVEGRPDAQEQSVALYTMHAAKGLEWPIVVPVNTMSRLRAPEKTVIDRETGRLYFPVFGVAPTGHEAAFENEKAELDRERIRLWYVAATRARELLILPRLDVPPTRTAWIALVDFSLAEVPGLDIGHHPLEFEAGAGGIENTQTRERDRRLRAGGSDCHGPAAQDHMARAQPGRRNRCTCSGRSAATDFRDGYGRRGRGGW